LTSPVGCGPTPARSFKTALASLYLAFCKGGAQPNVGFIGLGVTGHVRGLLTTAPSVWMRNVGSCGQVVFVDEAADAVRRDGARGLPQLRGLVCGRAIASARSVVAVATYDRPDIDKPRLER
jgi:hypothetical protein